MVVAKVPSPVRYSALSPELAEILATGVPVEVEPELMNANLAEAVDISPSTKS